MLRQRERTSGPGRLNWAMLGSLISNLQLSRGPRRLLLLGMGVTGSGRFSFPPPWLFPSESKHKHIQKMKINNKWRECLISAAGGSDSGGLIGWPSRGGMSALGCRVYTGPCTLIHCSWAVPPDIIKKSYWHTSSLRNGTINPVATRQPHQSDNLLSWCILRGCCPALAPDHRARAPPDPSGSGRRPSSASAKRRRRRPRVRGGYSWHAAGAKKQTDLLGDAARQVVDFWNDLSGITWRQDIHHWALSRTQGPEYYGLLSWESSDTKVQETRRSRKSQTKHFIWSKLGQRTCL